MGAPIMDYYFRILTRRGANAPDRAYDYVINENMIVGFVMVAFPADCGSSDIMTFIVNHQGRVSEKYLGDSTPLLAATMLEFNPNESWVDVDD